MFRGYFALLGGFVGLFGLGWMIYRSDVHAVDPIGVAIFSLLLLNGLWATWLRVSGREDRRKKRGPLSGRR